MDILMKKKKKFQTQLICQMGLVVSVSASHMVGREFASRPGHAMLCYFMHVAIFRYKHYPNRSLCDALCICYFNIIIS